MTAFSSKYDSAALSLQEDLYQTVSIMQHHDAMTGTHPYSTGLDYLKMIDSGYEKALAPRSVLIDEFNRLAKVSGVQLNGPLIRC